MFLRYVKVDLTLTVVAALAGAASIEGQKAKLGLAIVSGLLMFAAILVSSTLKGSSFVRDWYDGRAVAESVKTTTWRYVMGAEPFGLADPVVEVEKRFLDRLSATLNETVGLAKSLASDALTGPPITEAMKELRGKSLMERKLVYVDERVSNQQAWYAKKAKINQDRQGQWFSAVIAAQCFAMIWAFAMVAVPDLKLNLTGVFAALAAAFLAWLQLKQHQTLAESYTLAAVELGNIKSLAAHIQDEIEFTQYVIDAEMAMSREHTMWIARRTG